MLKPPQVDVLLVTTLKSELDVVLESESDWQVHEDRQGFVYYTRKTGGYPDKEFSIAVARLVDSAGHSASKLVALMVNKWRPRCLSTIGVCTGWLDNLSPGDVVIADRVSQYDPERLKDFQKGNITKEKVFQDMTRYHLDPSWIQNAQDFSRNWANTIKTRYLEMTSANRHRPKVHVAPIITGYPAENDPGRIPGIAGHVQTLFATEKGAATIEAIARIENVDSSVIVKAVADCTGHDEESPFHFYAIEASYRFLMAFLGKNLSLGSSGDDLPHIIQRVGIHSVGHEMRVQ